MLEVVTLLKVEKTDALLGVGEADSETWSGEEGLMIRR